MTTVSLQEALKKTEMGQIIATHHLRHLRADGTEETVVIEIDTPEECYLDVSRPSDHSRMWVCRIRCALFPQVYAMSGNSSLAAILNAAYFAADVLHKHPNAEAIIENTLPNFGLPVRPTTPPEDLAAEQKRPKRLRIPEVMREEANGAEYIVLE